MIPTYNEIGNVANLIRELLDLKIPIDILFIDDNSPDGTGYKLENIKGIQGQSIVHVIHRSSKLGVGSAHMLGISYAYAEKYTILITMDCDGTHDPKDIPIMLEYTKGKWGHEVVVGSRHIMGDSLYGWSLWRKTITNVGHILTKVLLKIPYDATGAFRLYRLDKIPPHTFYKITSNDYSFFFESLTILHINHINIVEIPIKLAARSAGNSKLKIYDLIKSLFFMIMLRYKIEFDRWSLIA
jgi:dolichol-phosphate mannosyltransferase